MNKRKLYESIMKNVAKEVKNALNEDNGITIYTAAYVESVADEMPLYSTFLVCKTFEEAVSMINGADYLDYVHNTAIVDGEEDLDTFKDISPDNGYDLEGWWVIEQTTL